MVLAAEVDAVGLNFVPSSKRLVRDLGLAVEMSAELAHSGVLGVGVFANQPLDEMVDIAAKVGLDVLQLHGDEAPGVLAAVARRSGKPVWKAFRVVRREDVVAIGASAWPCGALLLDSRTADGALGGTGKTFDWSILEDFAPSVPWVLAGGLNPDNVAEAVRRTRPQWVDVASGVEARPGKKDADKVRLFVEQARLGART